MISASLMKAGKIRLTCYWLGEEAGHCGCLIVNGNSEGQCTGNRRRWNDYTRSLTKSQLALTTCQSLSLVNMKSALRESLAIIHHRGLLVNCKWVEMLLTLPTTHDLPASEKLSQVYRFKRLFRTRIHSTDTGEQDVQSAKAHVTGKRIVNTKMNKQNWQKVRDWQMLKNATLLCCQKNHCLTQKIFILESLGSDVIDTACTRMVCGEKWLDHYVSRLWIIENEGHKEGKTIQVWWWRVIHSTKKVKIPDIPLLLSKTSLKRAGAVLNIEKDKTIIFKQPVKLSFSWHYCVNLKRRE